MGFKHFANAFCVDFSLQFGILVHFAHKLNGQKMVGAAAAAAAVVVGTW